MKSSDFDKEKTALGYVEQAGQVRLLANSKISQDSKDRILVAPQRVEGNVNAAGYLIDKDWWVDKQNREIAYIGWVSKGTEVIEGNPIWYVYHDPDYSTKQHLFFWAGATELPYPESKSLSYIQKRLDTLQNLSARFAGRQDIKDSSVNLANLLKAYSDFSAIYIKLLQQVPEEIARHAVALNVGADRLLQEWDALSRACEQRLGPSNVSNITSQTKANLQQAEQSLAAYRQRWRPNSQPYTSLKDPVPYFEKRYKISRSLYQPQIPLIAIPLTDFESGLSAGDEPLPWPALAHEFSHHLYHNALEAAELQGVHRGLQERLNQALALPAKSRATKTEQIKLELEKFLSAERYKILVDWLATAAADAGSESLALRQALWASWLEEVFADICGTLLTGPDYLISAQDLVMDRANTLAELTEHDWEHPAGFLRPLIPLLVLGIIANRSQNSLFQRALQMKLKEELDQRWPEFTDTVYRLPVEAQVTVQDLIIDVPFVVETVLDAPVWPGIGQAKQSNLWDLLDRYGQDSRADQDRERLQTLILQPAKFSIPPADLTAPNLPWPMADDDLNKLVASFPHFKQALDHLQQTIDEATEICDQDKGAVFWASLVGLHLSETDFHDNQANHPSPQKGRHGLWCGNHEHLDTGEIKWHTKSLICFS